MIKGVCKHCGAKVWKTHTTCGPCRKEAQSKNAQKNMDAINPFPASRKGRISPNA